MKVRHQRLGIALGVIAVVSGLLLSRMQRPVVWLASAPPQIGVWEAVETPLSGMVMNQLSNPKISAWEYRNPLDERLTCQLIAPHSFEAYREPYPLNLMTITAQRQVLPFGPNKPVRAWVLKNKKNGVRVLVYSWLHYRSGNTRLFGVGGIHQGNWDRLVLGWERVFESEPPCLVRLIAIIPSMDTQGTQTRRSLEEVARGIYLANAPRGEQR